MEEFVKKCVIFYNEDKQTAAVNYKKIKEFLENEKIEILSAAYIKDADFAVVIGGDGTLLRATQKLIKNEDIVVIAVNAGSLGFLTEIKAEEGIEACKSYLSGDYEIDYRGLLDVWINNEKKSVLNEVVFSNGGMARKPVKIGLYSDKGKINCYRGDGVIISTPTGSTAYSLSAGGPIISHYLDAVLITPIAPHNLTTRPIVIDIKREICVKVEEEPESDRESFVIADGESWQKISRTDKIKVKYSHKKLKLLLPKNRNYYSVLKEKLKWGDNLC